MNNKDNLSKLTIQGESSLTDKCSFVCNIILLLIFLVNQIFYKMDMLFFIILLTITGTLILFFGVIPERYSFTKESLEVLHSFKGITRIPYQSVFNYEETKRDSFINILQANSVKVYYMLGKKKRVILCRPRDVDTFVAALMTNCSELQEDETKSTIDVFFNE